ncbi:MAG TPA: dicarboxylate/amino acid:cation symporter [Kofleriaceae bacterium]|nr:dicarboxylate/amino acid:cation symporter [Kofleriaceae bacterium]
MTVPSATVRGRRRLPPHVRMLLGLIIGATFGLIANALWADSATLEWIVSNLADPTGKIFIKFLLMLVAPLLFAALVMGIAELDLAQLGRLGARMLGYTVVVSAIAVAIGLVMVNLVKPGAGMPDEMRERALKSDVEKRLLYFLVDLPETPPEVAKAIAAKPVVPKAPEQSVADLVMSMVPDNVIGAAGSNATLLGVIVFALVFGVALAFTPTPATERLREVIQGLYDVLMKLIEGILYFAPLGVGALLFSMTARLGFDILQQLAAYVGVVLAALAIHMFGVYSLSVRFLGGMSPIRFFRGVRLAMVTAFSTASSNATLPTALKVAEEELKLPRQASRFVLTAGSAMNQNGTALFEGVTVLFLAQLFGVHLDMSQQLQIMIICILAGIGTAGVPAGSLPVIAMILTMFHIPPEGLGLILGVDRFLDMCRTSLNVVGDLAAAVYVSRGVNEESSDYPQPSPP